jgi:thiopurine S-methyltransferase
MASAGWLLAEAEAVLVPLCGMTHDLGWLAERVQVYGVELSPIACQAVFDTLSLTPVVGPLGKLTRYSSGQLTLFCGDVFDLRAEMLPGLGAIWDRAALVALPEPVRIRYVSQLRRLMGDRGRVLLNTIVYNDCDKQGPPHSIRTAEVRRHYAGATLERLEERDATAEIRPHWSEAGMTEMHIEMHRIILGA